MAEAKIHDDYLVVIPVDVPESPGFRIGETINFIAEIEKASLYPKRRGVASVRRLHGIVKHVDTIEEGVKEGYAMRGMEGWRCDASHYNHGKQNKCDCNGC